MRTVDDSEYGEKEIEVAIALSKSAALNDEVSMKNKNLYTIKDIFKRSKKDIETTTKMMSCQRPQFQESTVM